ncbi:hypothetical protein QQS21_007936 [Conoideocrella luteorostrata]|uniref:Major facilitator superfamily (MFS) profile domain-containing protein n=1 Tax=Conoideocrella luteorostrata TaxID=1105319 RepID=A0AAJ0CJU0_9HYPO|nr:hypothetical protein QQS21_007936 [Conoideocrella luteorostrata]
MTTTSPESDTIATGDPRPPIDVELAQLAVSDYKGQDPFLVSFAANDPDNPINWRSSKKWAVTDVLSATGFNRIMVSTIMAPALPTIAREFNMNSAEAVMALSIYLLATAIGPLVLGPLSEVYGRTPILHASNIWFLVWNIACGFSKTRGTLIAARFMAGFGASAIYSLAGGVLGDVWRPEQRGKSLGIYLLIPLLGAAVGPIIGGFIAAHTDWRWSFWATSAFQGVMIIASYLTFEETFAPVILKKRAEKLRKTTGDTRYYAAFERLEQGKHLASILGRAVSRPMRLLALHPIIQVAAIISAFEYGLLYIVLATFAELWIEHYGQPIELSGLHYLACALGEIAGSQLGGPLMDFLYKKAAGKANGPPRPESRIPLMFASYVFVPVGLVIYGWTAEHRVSWVAVDAGIFIVMFAGQVAGMPIQAYVMDVYSEHTSSALAAMQFLRSLTAFLFPLFAPAMYSGLGYGWGNSVIALAALCVGVPAPLILWKLGRRFRDRLVSTY